MPAGDVNLIRAEIETAWQGGSGEHVQALIGGKLVDGDATMDVLNPATEEVLATGPRAPEAQLNAAVAAAQAAFLGLGVEFAEEGLHEFTQIHLIDEAK